jgi:hypothetical protein
LHSVFDLIAGQGPALVGKKGHDLPFEQLIKLERLIIVTQMVGQNRKRKLRWATAAVTPFEAIWAVITEIKPRIERLIIYGHFRDLSLPGSLVALH